MTEEKKDQPSASEAWHEVGQQFRSLGESLAAAFRTTWESEETRQHLEKVQAGLTAMIDEISQATKKMADSEEAQKVKAEVGKAAQSAQAASQQTAEEVRPHLLAAFHKIRTELDQIIQRMEQEEPASEPSTDDETTSDTGGVE
jgi:uncharacterized membrane protein YccC